VERKEMKSYMYSFTYAIGSGKGIGIILFGLLVTIMTIGCSDNTNNSVQKEKEKIESDLLGKEYDAAVRLARNNRPEGLLKLYKISTSGKSAELSEIADEELHYLLYKNTELWIKTFANNVDLVKFKSDFAATSALSELDEYEFPEGKISFAQYKKGVINRLRKIKGNKKEMELTDFVLQFYRRDKKS
jgi:hypothetical protein